MGILFTYLIYMDLLQNSGVLYIYTVLRYVYKPTVVLTRCSHFSASLGMMHDFVLTLKDTRF